MSSQAPTLLQDIQDSWFVSPSDLLAQLTLSDREALLAITEKLHFAKNEFIFQSGMASENMFILQDGRVKIFERSSAGKEVILWFCFPGEVFGLAEISQGRTRAVSAQTTCESTILTIRREAFNQFLRTHPDAALIVIDLLSRRLRGLGYMLLNLSCDDVVSRLTKLLVRLCTRYGKRKNNEVYLDVRLTHQEVADMIGTSRQTVSTTFSQLKREGIVEIIDHCIYIRSPELLTGISESLNSDRIQMNLLT